MKYGGGALHAGQLTLLVGQPQGALRVLQLALGDQFDVVAVHPGVVLQALDRNDDVFFHIDHTPKF